MGKKILFLDLDGTLLNDQKEITQGNKDALQGALNNGHRVVIATGRPLASAIIQNQRLGLAGEGCYVISFNGGMVYDIHREKLIYQQSIPLPTAKKIIALCNEMGIYVQAYDEKYVLAEPKNENETLHRYCNAVNMTYRIVEDFHTGLTQAPTKLLAIDFENRSPLEALQKRIQTELSQEADCFFSSQYYLEIVPKGLNKGNAIRRMCKELEIDISDAIACGDAQNDMAMLQSAGVGVAMANATPEIKAVADYITTRDNNHDGIAEVVEVFCK